MVAVVYEARPNVTVDCAALCIKSATRSCCAARATRSARTRRWPRSCAEALADAGLPDDAVELVAGGERSDLAELATQDGVVDLVIPRGGEGLKEALKEVATVPVMYAASGNCHVYVHADADLEMARRVAYNAKVQRPGVCNCGRDAARHTRRVAGELLPGLLADLAAAGVELVGDERARAAARRCAVGEATDADWDTEYLGLKMAVGVVDSLDEAIEHVNRHGTGHSEAIITVRARRATRSPAASTPRRSTSTPRRGSPTASSSGWAPRSATRPRSSTRAGRSGSAS